ncbi:TIGR03087 family PEP-CTERM/XrtA system glycosyltransferase [Aestuariirhabdus litorea]|uniref:TIGR03087 family PEP-CTERM/XrtA system glycosyltransferase n=1 Tax=Aestuariirhabdus litorea TaxID=2528527 RepID=A0A3P3VPQ7_9GAMM|nr:TIGR03087 family PEP-CTERM/XrtA system glycosyltransferase [Aestuariirhabdus litorea]RRJ84590.1 TIGR03087 family PEP-CTERM/XrtA system glycosyltransferase [Aestuariirhabdus litorea]RWW97816.1 TIGR03087 family PEP-CTERM/XrtA system glycosyltransferase [Endozoicomonadaceae bacterium GTF-13]
MESVIFAVHRIPYPPNKGDKIRSFQMLKALSQDYKVILYCFVDDPRDLQFVGKLKELASEVYYEELTRWQVIARAVKALLTGRSITEAVYCSRRMRAALKQRLSNGEVRSMVAFSSSMGQYLPDSTSVTNSPTTLIDFVDVDSLKWRDYSQQKRVPMRWIYGREAKLLSRLEKELTARAGVSTFVTRAEKELFCRQLDAHSATVKVFGNGVDLEFFDPSIEHPSPYNALGMMDLMPICFVGAMDYYANEDAAVWFMEQVMPLVLKARPDSGFFVVGRDPSHRLKRIARSTPGALVVGGVADVRPYLQHCALVVAPLRIARGMQNKVLEALAMNKFVVASSAAAEGVDIDMGNRCMAACRSAEEMAAGVLAAFDLEHEHCDGRQQVMAHYGWQPQMEKFMGLLK